MAWCPFRLFVFVTDAARGRQTVSCVSTEIEQFSSVQKQISSMDSSLRLIHITAFSDWVCGRQLCFCREIGIFLSLHWCSLLWKMPTAAVSVNQPWKIRKLKLRIRRLKYEPNKKLFALINVVSNWFLCLFLEMTISNSHETSFRVIFCGKLWNIFSAVTTNTTRKSLRGDQQVSVWQDLVKFWHFGYFLKDLKIFEWLVLGKILNFDLFNIWTFATMKIWTIAKRDF